MRSKLKKYALLSVSDKKNIETFAKRTAKAGYEILATGKTAKMIKDAGIPCILVEDYASFPEVFDGRVKTLQPRIFGGILMRRGEENDIREAKENNIYPIDIVCVNLYPFPEVVKRKDIGLDTKIENIDIGGPSLIRAAAKNYKYVSILTNPEQYEDFLTELESGEIKLSTREKLASAAFSHTSFYDTLIADFFEDEFNLPKKNFRLNLPVSSELRYGENPHQSAALYGNFYDYYEILHGKELSYNNIIDLNAAAEIVLDMEGISCAIIKHTNPCGAAVAQNIFDAYEAALSCDPVSAFGGIVAFNSKVDIKTAQKLNEIFLEIIVAPDYDEDALTELLKKKNRRLLKIKNKDEEKYLFKSVPGGIILQDKDFSKLKEENLKVVTKRNFTPSELSDLRLAWVICKHTKSNAIIYVKNNRAVGVGAGQMSRVDSTKTAARKAKEQGFDLNGAVAASDAFFPFADGVEEIASNGITAIIQPGGSVRDEEVIVAADKHNLAMIFTGIRNFKH